MAPDTEQTRVDMEEIPPVGSKPNWWGILGLFCMVASAFLSVGVLVAVAGFLKTFDILEIFPFLG
jgi:hypothetical protein